MSKIFSRLKQYSEISDLGEISRRYFVMNAFDGALTMLGVVIGAYISNIRSASTIISAGIAGSIAMAISGISGAYMTERAERLRKLKSLEKAMLKELRNSIHYRSHRFAVLVTSLTDGLSPFLSAMIVLSPFFLLNFGFLSWNIAFYLSIALTLIFLFSMGMYLAKVSEESMIMYGLQMLCVGILTAFVCIAISIALGGRGI
ncbi:MAG: hypothetical protein DRN18_03770 [Thermoplasmata archaeon]|nr:MAG: hypothetical protein DRN18_03770 [Thermoplasmata archaeon]